MGKHLVYIAGAFAIIIVLCSITATVSKKDTSNSRPIVTNPVNEVQIDDNGKVTTNIWDYLRSKDENTIGASNETTDKTSQDQPELTIILK